jgi:hypothetical protein
MDNNMYTVTAELITERVNHHGAREPGIIGDAVTKMCGSVEQLRETLNEGQILILRDAENHYADVDGETMRYYYKAGFGDALRFLLDWGKAADQ